MQVPTSSMQPTLYGVTIENLLRPPGREIRRPGNAWSNG